ncbi:MAG: circularly permuted type 2 ATP-grasp protein, partial [Planctomycetota bacterium]
PRMAPRSKMSSVTTGSPLSEYRSPGDVYDELLDETGSPRPHWTRLRNALAGMSATAFQSRKTRVESLLREHGATFQAHGEASPDNRPWQLDVLPFMIASDEWRSVSLGVAQRARLLNRLTQDLYGPCEVIKRRLIPSEIVFGNPQFHTPFRELATPDTNHLQLYGVELARSSDGRWWAMADRSDRTFGLGYALENRVVLKRTIPRLIRNLRVERLAPFFSQVRETLSALSRRATEFPRIVLLSEGPSSPVYFEDLYLSSYLGYPLVEGGDLAVRNDSVSLKSLDGLIPIDVILKRTPEWSVDPLELGGASLFGVPGLLHAVRSGNVAVANTPGTGLLESPVFMPYLERLCGELLGENLSIPSIATWWMGEESARQEALKRLDDLVIKPAFRYSGSDEYVVSELTPGVRERLLNEIATKPGDFVAQEKVKRSAAPVWSSGQVATGHVALRSFAVGNGDDFSVAPGALVRFASHSGPVELSISSGEGSKDAWVLSDGPVKPVTLLRSSESDLTLARSTQLPSRAADNLFWLGRSLELADSTARWLRTTVERMSVEDDQEALDLPRFLASVIARSKLEVSRDQAADDSGFAELEARIFRIAFDSLNRLSLQSAIHEMSRLASHVRDRISYDIARSIQRIDEHFCASKRDAQTDSLEILSSVTIELAACSGLIAEGMVRGPAWRFLEVGRRIERCLRSIETIGASLRNSDPGVRQRDVLEALLDIFECRSTYRNRYLAEALLRPVLDLLIADETHPRSIGYQLVRLNEHVDELPNSDSPTGLSPSQKLVRSALHDLRLADVESLCQMDDGQLQCLEDLLSSLTRQVEELAEELTRTYLVHSGAPRQILAETPTPTNSRLA